MTAQLDVTCPEYLAEVREFADSTGQREQLEEKLKYLIANLPDTWAVLLYQDLAPYSFFWIQTRPTGERGLMGGLIYHGQHDGYGNGGAPTFSVNLIPTDGWSIHT